MSAPIPNEAPAAGGDDKSFKEDQDVSSLCGFKVPSFSFSIGISIPPIAFPPPLPKFLPSLGISCPTSNPVDVVGDKPNGGGRVASFDPDPDDAFEQQSAADSPTNQSDESSAGPAVRGT